MHAFKYRSSTDATDNRGYLAPDYDAVKSKLIVIIRISVIKSINTMQLLKFGRHRKSSISISHSQQQLTFIHQPFIFSNKKTTDRKYTILFALYALPI